MNMQLLLKQQDKIEREVNKMNLETALQMAERNMNKEEKKLQNANNRKGATESELANIKKNFEYTRYVYNVLCGLTN